MIDLDLLKRAAADDEGRPIELGRSMIEQIVAEIEAGRRAQAQVGQTFGLPEGVRL